MPTIYGYIRVSTRAQKDERQWLSLRQAGVEDQHIFVDKATGKHFNRPAYRRMLCRLRPGDLLVVQSIDLSLIHILGTAEELGPVNCQRRDETTLRYAAWLCRVLEKTLRVPGASRTAAHQEEAAGRLACLHAFLEEER